MAKPLLIVESPAKARTIEKFLGRRFQVKASLGHVRDLPKSQLGVNVDNHFEPKYITIRGKGNVIKELRKAAKDSPRVLLATDPDREGEAISWHLAHILDLPDDSPCRIEFREITKEAVNKALQDPRPIDNRLVDAQQARRVLDRLVGYKLSPLLWRKVRKGLSAGRVQSVALRLICDREEEIAAFEPQEYWTLDVVLHPDGLGAEDIFSASFYGRAGEGKQEIANQDEVEEIMAALQGSSFSVSTVTRRERRRHPAPPFTTSSLQQEAARKLNFSARRTMVVAQQLYEGLDLGKEGTVGLITYIRTDSTRIADTARAEVIEHVKERFGPQYVGKGSRGRTVRGAQEAHEAIRPTSVRRTPEQLKNFLSRDQLRLYKLIWQRLVASQMADVVLDTVSVDISAGPYILRANGQKVKFPGFTVLYQEGKDEEDDDQGDRRLPDLVAGQALEPLEMNPKQHFTQPPPRFSEAMLVKTLEEKGIGRPSTYAPIIETLLQRGYVVKEDNRFHPTELGKVVLELLVEHFPQIVNVNFTARIEGELDRVEEGEADWREIVQDFYRGFALELERAEKEIGKIALPEEEAAIPCEKCGRMMVIKHGRYGKFLACPGFPACRNTKRIQETLGVNCPECGGEMVVRKTKRGRPFYGCANYPDCRFVVWNKPSRKTCPQCGAFMTVKRRRGQTSLYQCARPGCGFSGSGDGAE
ncbi:MAG TPA: type I DNA topoisomerase [Firmicutes bacterium]|nr:type I DNA topoisomerase [Bacillota bacterium]